eukprot:CAMPEP_0202688036 /NCGR_PEP_ID=MMETSP1385-20130828/3577_1 /ASSEMBLY_ACC=CAM_ASM_000861 /TAXON_ID=933848 /ORGANISM="Elphidium margaritaceum" /LENGTH=212 /DNA_ID=CAMNT_0049342911 /DNA_START=191 /DNA_END=829 /DNA_ORIENTATION=-
MESHLEDHEGDYNFTVPYLESVAKSGTTRKALVTPCVQQATSSYLIDTLLSQNFAVYGVAVPESSEKFIEGRFKMKTPTVRTEKEKFDGKDIEVKYIESGSLRIEQRVVESFKLKSDELQTFDVVFDEMPLLRYYADEAVKSGNVQTTVLGHGLKKGGILYLQCEGAKDRKQRIELINNIQSYYPESHFDLVESRRTPWTRQFLFLKVRNTV